MSSWSDKESVKLLHSKIYVGNLLIKMYYPNVVTYLAKNLGPEEATARLFQIGQEIGRKLLEIRAPKSTDVKKLVKQWYKIMWNSTKGLSIKEINRNGKILYKVVDKKCGVCDPETVIEGLKVPCSSIAGYLDACMEYLSKKVTISSYKVQTVKSVSTGDPYCEHHIEVER
jgi:predicted hydrocarbon binding protein